MLSLSARYKEYRGRGSIRVALWQRFTYYKTLCRCQSDTLRYDRDTLHKDLSYKNQIVMRTIYAFTCRVNDFFDIIVNA